MRCFQHLNGGLVVVTERTCACTVHGLPAAQARVQAHQAPQADPRCCARAQAPPARAGGEQGSCTLKAQRRGGAGVALDNANWAEAAAQYVREGGEESAGVSQ